MIKITVFDNGVATFDRYRVCVNNDVFAMSHNADSPQGVNQYAGAFIKPDKYHRGIYGIKLPGIPACILRAVMERAIEVAFDEPNI